MDEQKDYSFLEEDFKIEIEDVYNEGIIELKKLYRIDEESYISDELAINSSKNEYDVEEPTLISFYYEAVCLLEKIGFNIYKYCINEFIYRVNILLYYKSLVFKKIIKKLNDDKEIDNCPNYFEIIKKLCSKVLYISRFIKYIINSKDDKISIVDCKLEYEIPSDVFYWFNDVIILDEKYREEHHKELKIKKDSNNCVCIAYPSDVGNETNSFFSLSGCRNDYLGENEEYNYFLQDEYDLISRLIIKRFGYKFIDCHLNDDVIRYTYIGKYNGRILKRYSKFSKDLKYSEKKIPREYSCCEKKITSKMGIINYEYKKLFEGKNPENELHNYVFLIKMMSCEKCRPALVGCNNIIYLYKSNKEKELFNNIKWQIILNPNKQDINEPLICEEV